jgi:hypothetical protein
MRRATLVGLAGVPLFIVGSLLENNTGDHASVWKLSTVTDISMLVCAVLAAGLLALDSAGPRTTIAVGAAVLTTIAVGQFAWYPVEGGLGNAAIGMYVQLAGALAMLAGVAWRLALAPGLPAGRSRLGAVIVVAGAALTLGASFMDYFGFGGDYVSLWGAVRHMDSGLAVELGVLVAIVIADVLRPHRLLAVAAFVVAGLSLGEAVFFPLELKFKLIGIGAYLLVVGTLTAVAGSAIRLLGGGAAAR